MFTRQNILLQQRRDNSTARVAETPKVSDQEFRVLVVNSSSEMAKEISLQLTLSIPGCSIMYAPSLELARLILARRQVELVVSSTVLPDGGLARLKAMLNKLPQRDGARMPNVVLVGDAPDEILSAFGEGEFDVSHMRRVRSTRSLPDNAFRSLSGRVLKRARELNITVGPEQGDTARIKNLGADLRNDLNNPLQEIVAMVFIAKSTSGESASSTTKALDAIDKAAKNMAVVVRGLEEKIRAAVLQVG